MIQQTIKPTVSRLALASVVKKHTLTALALLLVCLSAPLHAVAQQDRPNIVFILMDNLGYGELGVYGGGVPSVVRPRHALTRSPAKACGC